jgi:signal transduction histidine kinase
MPPGGLTLPNTVDHVYRSVERLMPGRAVRLYLYDDVAHGFTLVLPQGIAVPDGGEPPEKDALLLAGLLVEGRPTRGELDGLHGPWSLFPLIDASPMGILAIAGTVDDQTTTGEMLAMAREAAGLLTRARPDVDHNCLFRAILEVDHGGIAVVEGPEYLVSYATSAFRQLTRRPDMPLLGRSLRAIFDPALLNKAVTLLDEVMRTGRASHQPQLQIRDQYGSRYFELNLVPCTGDDRVTNGVYIILWPRTDVVLTRRALESSIEQLGDSQSVLTAVLDGTNNAIVFTGRDGTVQYANRRAGELLGLDLTTIVGAEAGEVTSLLSRSAANGDQFVSRSSWLLAHPDQTATEEIELMRPVRRLLERYSAPVHARAGGYVGRVEVYTDVTETRALQRTKDDFLSLVSHELKTPVTSIKGYAQLLRRRAEREGISESVLGACTVIERQVGVMETLIDTLLDLSRLDSGRLEFDPLPVDLRSLAARSVDMLRMTDDVHVIEADLPDGPVIVNGDAGRLEQALANLLSNATKFRSPGTIVSVSLHADHEVHLTVQDQGEGIPAEMQSHIFERFYRGGDAERSNGMGIGLYITRAIVERHGGTIGVRSRLGEGSAFLITLPRAEA